MVRSWLHNWKSLLVKYGVGKVIGGIIHG